MKKKALLSSILSIVLCLTMISGATFALFTDSETVNIAVIAGKVDIDVTVQDLSTLSYPGSVDVDADWKAAVNNVGTFTNGGTATYVKDGETIKNQLTLSLITPGDAVKLNLKIANNSDVKIKYRVKVGVVDGLELFQGLKVNVSGVASEYKGTTYVSDWSDVLTPAAGEDKTIATVPVVIEFPYLTAEEEEALGVKQNDLMGKSTTIYYTVEAVQGNGDTVNVVDDEKITYVYSATDLQIVAQNVKNGETYAGKTIKLMSDIDLAGVEWMPIGSASTPFKGTFDGAKEGATTFAMRAATPECYTISNLNVNMPGKSNAGLFGQTVGGAIKNLVVENAKVIGYLNVGVVAGTPYTSTYTNITVKGHVEVLGMSYVGGVGGKSAYANWTNITVDVDETSYVTANSVENGKAYRTYVGGVIGFMGEGGHKVSNVTSNIDVIGTTCDVGGIVGIAHYGNIFENVSCSGDVTITNAMEAADAEEMGGIAGVWHNGGSNVVMNNCTFTGTLTANITEGVDLSNNTVAGNAYSATGTGMLIIDGKDTNGSWVVTDEASFKDALTEGGSTTLYKDLKLSETMVIAEGVEVVLNMNGKTLSATGLDAENAKAAVLKNNGTLTINGGVISSTGTNGGSAVVNNGTLTVVGTTLNGAPNAGESWPSYTVNNTGVMTINNATITSYHGAVASYGAGALVTLNDSTIDMKGIPGFTSHGMYTYNDGKIIVNGGIYANKATDQSASGASVINGNVEVNGGTFTGRIENYYGTPVIKGGTFDNNPTNRVAAGYEVTVNADGTWTVSGAKVGSAADLNAALNSGKVAELTEDIATGSDFTAENTNINLGENTMAMTGSDQKVSGNLTVTNGTVDVSKGYFDIRPANGAEVVIENVVFNNTKKSKTFGSSTDHVESALEFCPVTTEGKTTIIFRNCTFNNAQVLFEAMSGKPGVVDAIFENCTFNNFGNSDAIEVKNYLTINITIKDCTFNITSTSNVAIVDALGSSNVTVNFEGNNVVNGVAATPTTDASLVGTVDEVKVFSTTSVKVVSASVDTVNGLENVTVTGIATK